MRGPRVQRSTVREHNHPIILKIAHILAIHHFITNARS
jgi:hypothetical protein